MTNSSKSGGLALTLLVSPPDQTNKGDETGLDGQATSTKSHSTQERFRIVSNIGQEKGMLWDR
jgi:hypothetical protein